MKTLMPLLLVLASATTQGNNTECANDEEGHFLMVIGGYDGRNAIDDVELVSLDPTSQPLPDCLTKLKPFPVAIDGVAGALDFSGKLTLLYVMSHNTYYVSLS